MPLPRCHVLIEPSCPLRGRQDSHSTWINQLGSRHHPYRSLGDFTITLTTEWAGQWHFAGEADWRGVVGTATTSAATTITTVESRTHLVGADCNQDPHGPWCDG